MRFARACLVVLAACGGAPSAEAPPPDSADPPRPAACALECRADHHDCATFPFESLPARCQELCYWGHCCTLEDGAWLTMTIDCARPVDAGVDAPGAPARIEILPAAPSVAAGTTIEVSVIATHDDLTTADVAADAAWTSADPSIASVTGRTLTAFRPGDTTITAMYQGRASTMRVTVTDPVLRSIDVAPSNPSILVGRTRQFSATGFFSDGTTTDLTTLVLWSSSAPDVASISSAAGSQGLATARADGQTTIEATSNRIAGTTTLTVEPLSLDTRP